MIKSEPSYRKAWVEAMELINIMQANPHLVTHDRLHRVAEALIVFAPKHEKIAMEELKDIMNA